jgi:phosphatidylethanolamine-binding protein (PEBP) family uncharacterized protein
MMNIQYPKFNVSQDSTDMIDINLVKTEPSFSLKVKDPSALYTLIMMDPDAPTGFDGDKNKNRTFLHWWLANINTNGKIKYDIFMPYTSPAPPQGKHRYYFKLFKQPAIVSKPMTNIPRIPYDINKWISTYRLQPVAELDYIVAAE